MEGAIVIHKYTKARVDIFGGRLSRELLNSRKQKIEATVMVITREWNGVRIEVGNKN